MFWVVARGVARRLLGCSGWLLGSFHGPSYTIESQWGKFGTLLPPGVQLLPHFEVWFYRACQSLQCGKFQISVKSTL